MEISGEEVFIDLFFLILCLRVIYSAVTRGIIQESFKIVGLLAGAFLAFQYYTFLGDKIEGKLAFLNEEYLGFFSFLLIFLGTVMIFSLIRLIVSFLAVKGEVPFTERWLLLVLGVFRAAFLSSVIVFLIYLFPFGSKHFSHPVPSVIFRKIAPQVYLWSLAAYAKLNPQSTLTANQAVREYCLGFADSLENK